MQFLTCAYIEREGKLWGTFIFLRFLTSLVEKSFVKGIFVRTQVMEIYFLSTQLTFILI